MTDRKRPTARSKAVVAELLAASPNPALEAEAWNERADDLIAAAQARHPHAVFAVFRRRAHSQ